MAAPITHILFALELRRTPTRQFICGVSFPDIRYLGHISREETHSLLTKDITDATSFSSGMAFHQYIDEQRETYWQSQGIYERLPQHPYVTQALKFLEDMVLYDQFHSWQDIAAMCRDVLEEERQFNIPLDALTYWHHLIGTYVSRRPSLDSAYTLSSALDPPGTMTNGLKEILPLLVHDTELARDIRLYYAHFIGQVRTNILPTVMRP